jgi:choline dehydrogenase-like flavoprotein
MTENTEFLKNKINEFILKYEEMPPHWIYRPDSHPYSGSWRQGSGEEFVDCFVAWFEENCKTTEEKINYFKKYSPPPRWLATVVEFIWEVEGWNEAFYDYTPYLKKLEEQGFKGTSEYEKDLDDEKWLNLDYYFP